MCWNRLKSNAGFIPTGVLTPTALAVLNNTLFVANFSGKPSGIGKIKADFITGLSQPTGIAVKN